tara:strand:+ start:492 stop:728 length:237 start_codon:yes stop_codon:yes gene_type:complete
MRDYDDIYREVQIPILINDLWEYEVYRLTINELSSYAKKEWLREITKDCPTPQATYERLKSRMDVLGMPYNTLKTKED